MKKKKKIDSRTKSLFESGCNIVIGYTINFIANVVILPHYGMPFSWGLYTWIGALYTVVSLVRSYFIRRVFANGFYEAIFGKKEVVNGRKENKIRKDC